MPPLFTILLPVFLCGLLLGSFLNVVIARLPAGQSIATPRSCCPGCRHTIRWYDNVPVLSYLLLRGRCRACGRVISWRYPTVELGTALFLSLAVGKAIVQVNQEHRGILGFQMDGLLLSTSFAGAAAALLGLLLIPLLVIDWKHYLLPDVLTFPGMLLGVLLVCTHAIFLDANEDQLLLHRRVNITAAGAGRSQGNVFLTGAEHLIFGRLLAIVVAGLLLLAIRWIYQALRHREGLGFGDVKLLAMIASFLGLAPALLALFVGVFAASLFAVVLLARGRASASSRLPFGTFLAAGGLVSALFGSTILHWYKSLL